MSNRAESTRGAIVEAAVAVFGRYGYRKTTMDLLARAADISRPAIYQYFDGKAAVYRAVAARVGRDLLAAAETAAKHGETAADRIYNALVVKLDFAADTVDPGHRRELAIEAESGPVADVLADTEARYAAIVASVLRGADDLDLLDVAITAEDASALLIDAMIGIARSPDGGDRMRARLRQLVDLAVRGLSTNRTETT